MNYGVNFKLPPLFPLLCGLTFLFLYGHAQALPILPNDLPPAQEMVLTSEEEIPLFVWASEQALKKGMFRDVIYLCEQVLKKQNNEQALANLAAAWKGLGDEEKYISEEKLFRNMAPASPALYLALAMTYRSKNNLHGAEQALKDGLKISSDKTLLLMNLGNLYVEQARFADATREYAKLLHEPDIPHKLFLNANFALCRIGMQQKKFDEVIERGHTLAEAYPLLPQGYFFWGAALVADGQTDQAIKVYETLKETNPQSPLPYQELALLYADKIGDYKQAFFLAEQGVKKFSGDPKSHDVLGWLNYKQKRYQVALEQFRKAVDSGVTTPQFVYHLGLAYQQLGKPEAAKNEYEKALKILGSGKDNPLRKELQARIEQVR